MGSQDIATGSSASQIVEWLFGCQGIAMVHGMIYNGPQLLTLPPEGDIMDAPGVPI